jgi:CRISPR/Cas system Type II protein with McrA/HNH and RuvC-like nuclease domain
MAERKPLQKKIRFDVFKRDMFTCQYCGSKPPAVVLEVDHIDPVKNGGDNNIHNLITACFDCNRGKSDRLLSVIPESLERRAEVLAEKEEQIKAFNKLVKAQKRREEKAIDQVQQVFRETYEDRQFTSTFRTSVRNFLAKLPQHIVDDAMSRACSRTQNANDATRYFCGICWNIIREGAK